MGLGVTVFTRNVTARAVRKEYGRRQSSFGLFRDQNKASLSRTIFKVAPDPAGQVRSAGAEKT